MTPSQHQSRRPLLLAIPAVYPAWLAMQTLHELGHVLHAWFSGGVVQRFSIPWLGFSLTELSHNPAPRFVATGGVLWGTLLPILLAGVAWLTARPNSNSADSRPGVLWVWRGAAAFAGFCLIANGVYMASALFGPVGDAADLVRMGVPAWLFGGAGVSLAFSGLMVWHALGRGSTPIGVSPPHYGATSE